MSAQQAIYETMPTLAEKMLEENGPTIRTATVAEMLHCHPSHVRAMCQNGELPAVKFGSRWFVKTIPFAELLEGDTHDC